MKKKSILLTCIVAIMALAMFVGCDNAPVFPDMPKSVKGGYLTQTGVILTGQEVTADKFTLTVEYDNGDEPTVMPATNIQLDGTGNVFAVAGLDSDNNPVDTEKLLVAFTDANRIEATGFKESYTVAEAKAIKPSDIQVTAYYGTEGSVALTSSEFVVKVVNESALDTLVSPSNPTAQVEVVVRALVGVEGANQAASNVLDETYVITVNYEEPVETEYAIEELTAVAFAPEYVLKALSYDEVPAPTLDDVIFNGKYDNGVEFWGQKLPADTEISLAFVDAATGLELINKNLVGDTASYEVKAIYNDKEVPFVGTPELAAAVTVLVEPMKDYVAPSFTEGDAVVAPVANDFDVVLYADGVYERLDAAAKENVEFVYGTNTVEAGFIPMEKEFYWSSLYVKATYMGAFGITEDVVATVDPATPPATIDSIEVALKSAAVGPNKQQYADVSDIPAAERAVASVTVNWSDETKQVIDGNFAAWGFSFEYSDSKGNVVVPSTGSVDLSDIGTLYIKASYAYAAGKDPETAVSTASVPLQTAYASALDIDVKYANVATGTDTPMYGTTFTYTVNAVNEYGVVDTLETSEYVVDGNVPSTVTGATSITVNALVDTANGQDMITGTLALADPIAYVEVSTLTIAPKEGTMPAYLIDTAASNYFNANTVANYEVKGFTPHGNATVTIDADDPFEILKAAVASGENSVRVRVSYTDKTGKLVENVLVEYKYTGVAFTEADSIVLVSTEDGCDEIAEGKMYYGKTYNLSNITWDSEEIKEHGDDAKLTVKGYCKGDYEAGVTTLKPMSGPYTDNYAGTINFVIGYTNNQGAEAEKVFPVTLTEAPRN